MGQSTSPGLKEWRTTRERELQQEEQDEQRKHQLKNDRCAKEVVALMTMSGDLWKSIYFRGEIKDKTKCKPNQSYSLHGVYEGLYAIFAEDGSFNVRDYTPMW